MYIAKNANKELDYDMKLFWQADNPGGQRYYRSTLPVKHLRKNFNNLEIDMDDAISSLDYDGYLYHRVAQPPVFLKKRGKKILWELDDDLWHIPDWSPAFETYRSAEVQSHLSWFLENADEIIVSTEPLAKEVRSRSKRPVTVLPNLIDLEIWRLEEKWSGGEIKILWAGSPFHERDIEGISQPIEQLVREFDNIKVVFFGDLPTSMAEFHRVRWNSHGIMAPHKKYQGKVEFIQFQPIEFYFNTLQAIKADIALAPLFPCEFAEAKSNIKYVESSILGTVTLASNIAPYRATKAVLIEKQAQWYDAIKYMIQNHQKRAEISEIVKQDVLANWTWSCPTAEKWYDFFKKIGAS